MSQQSPVGVAEDPQLAAQSSIPVAGPWVTDREIAAVAYDFNWHHKLFSTGENSNHGQPEHDKCPEDSYRKVINLHCYTTHRDDDAAAQPHFALYKTEAWDFASGLGADYRRSGEHA